MNSGKKEDDVNNVSIKCNMEFLRRLKHLNSVLKNSININDRRSIECALGCISRFRYHPYINSGTIIPFDMLLLPKTSRSLEKRLQFNSKKSRSDRARSSGDRKKDKVKKPLSR